MSMSSANYLQLPHFDNSAFPHTSLSENMKEGAITLPVKSGDGFSTDYFATVGILGTEGAEAVLLSGSPIGNSLMIPSGIQHDHKANAPIAETPYDQLEVYRAAGATEPADASFALLATVSIDFEAMETLYEDLTPVATGWYKWKYKNSYSGAVSDLSGRAVQSSTDVLYASPAEVLRDLEQSKDADLVKEIIETICDLIDSECQRGGRLYYRSVTEVHDMENERYSYFPNNTPISADYDITVEYRDSSDAWTADTRDAWAKDNFIKFDKCFLANRNNALRFTFTAGFFSSDNIPKMLNMYTRKLAREMYLGYKTTAQDNIKSKKVGNYAVTYKDDVDLDVFKTKIANSQIVQKYGVDMVYGAIRSTFREVSDNQSIYI